jgi:hypothetical protein
MAATDTFFCITDKERNHLFSGAGVLPWAKVASPQTGKHEQLTLSCCDTFRIAIIFEIRSDICKMHEQCLVAEKLTYLLSQLTF